MSVALSSIVLCITMHVVFPQSAVKHSPREKVETAIDAAIRLLESKDYRTFLLQFVPPEQVKARSGSPEALGEWIEHFSGQAASVLAALRYARTQTPTYDDAKTIATFPLKEEAGPSSLKMVKIGQYWYIGNK